MSTDPDRETQFFMRPKVIERTFSRFFGFLVGTLGLGLSHHYLLEVRGRRSGRPYSTPVNLLARQLIARQWTRAYPSLRAEDGLLVNSRIEYK